MKKDLATLYTNLTPDLFEKATAQDSSEKIARPIISYFTDALLRLKRNKVAMMSVFTILFITGVGVVGPFFFPKLENGISYENSQNPDLRSFPPTLGQTLLVTSDFPEYPEPAIDLNYDIEAPLATQDTLKPPAKLEVIGKANVNGVNLQWETVPGVSGYSIFRAVVRSDFSNLESMRTDPYARGVLVGTVTDPAQYNYTDSSGLDPNEFYVYSVISIVSNMETYEEISSNDAISVKTNVEKIIRLSEALQIKPDTQEGEYIRGRAYLFGTDSLGRDVFARTVQGTRVDLFLALVIPSIALLIGLIYGSISGLAGGVVDMVMMRIIEIFDSLPELLLLVILQVAMGKGLQSLIISLAAFSWIRTARLVRGEVLRLREIEFVHAALLLGSSPTRIVFKHLAPNLLGVLIIVWSGAIPGVITAEAFLSLIGLGLEQPAASWGSVLQDTALRFQTSPHQFFFPALVLAIALLAFYLLGDALRDAFDPKLRGRE